VRRSFVIAVLLAAALVGTGVVVAGGSSEPDRPPWADVGGKLAPEKAPATFEVAGPDGQSVVCANGRRLQVRKSQLFGPPPVTPDRLMLQRPAKEELVWRCGTGANPHLNARLVPESQDPLRQGG
jgi:hypothetical protein